MKPPEEFEEAEPRRCPPRAWEEYGAEEPPGGEKEWELSGEEVPGDRESGVGYRACG